MRLRSVSAIAVGLLLAATAASAQADKAKLTNPSALKEQAPAVYKALFDTSAGQFVVEVHRDWAPKGADRFYNLVKNGFYDDGRFFRVIPNFMVQFGINGDPAIQRAWGSATNLTDDPVKQSNARGLITFATAGPNTRTTQVFINYKDNAPLDKQGFAPFGRVISGMDVVDKLVSEYREQPNAGNAYLMKGNAYITKSFPKLDYIKTATIQP
ncbi:MAG: peptidylprolyl isomerase [Acidobacteria bacterium]|nr:peptidylprolyl isomerase [Acidobacteriota bacterium]